MQCPKCAYVRQPSDTAPDYECPKCGIIYAKYDPAAEARKRELLEKRRREREEAAAKQEAEKAAVEPEPPKPAPALPLQNTKTTSCKACGGLVSREAKACPHCGQVNPAGNTVEQKVFCRDCGEKINVKAEICPKCGVRQIERQRPRPRPKSLSSNQIKNKFIAAIIALFLGGLGIHRFYLERPLSGFIYLIFCWTLIPAIIAFFEAINLFLMTDKEFESKYC